MSSDWLKGYPLVMGGAISTPQGWDVFLENEG